MIEPTSRISIAATLNATRPNILLGFGFGLAGLR
jgi:hypothetical protein